jgi:DNA helicase II / ATP-dependent DNA helicase PcrA
MVEFSKLNPKQQEVVTTTEGPLMILAGAGSGKTRTLVYRIMYLLDEKKIPPWQMLALTFSNKAAKEMAERVSQELGVAPGSLQVTTFHSFCSRLLRSEANYLGLSRNFTIYDESESKAVATSLLGRRGISTKELSPYEILYYIDDLKNKGYYQGRPFSEEEKQKHALDLHHELYPYFQEYETELHRSNAVDFGGLITGVLQLFHQFPEVLAHYQKRYHYLLIDEYQDTNRSQFELVQLLAQNHRNICVVGDEDQSIYSWRGADIRNILEFEKVFPETKILKLEQNYRSSKNIIDAATAVIANNTMRKGKVMWTENPVGEVVQVIDCANDKNEAEYVAREILHLKERFDYLDMAIFYRANSQSRLIEDYLRQFNIPYRILGGVMFYERKEIKDMLAYLRLVINDKDSLAVSRIINVPTRGIGATTLRKLEEEAIRRNISLWEMVQEVLERPEEFQDLRLGAKVKAGLQSLVSLIQEAKLLHEDKIAPSTIYEKLLNESGYLGALKASRDYESQARVENLSELGSAISQYEEDNPEPNLVGFLETITLDTSVKDASEEMVQAAQKKGEVSLMTVHGAKGLEYPCVFLVGAEENIFPSYKSLENGPIGVEEERRLFYVAMTRAMSRLYITYAQGRMLFGQVKFNGPGRFLLEIPTQFCQRKRINYQAYSQVNNDYSTNSVGHQQRQGKWQDYSFSQRSSEFDEDGAREVRYQIKSPAIPSAAKGKFIRGDRVRHSLYGEGRILEIEGYGENQKVVIRFSDGAQKRFVVRLAPLTLIT